MYPWCMASFINVSEICIVACTNSIASDNKRVHSQPNKNLFLPKAEKLSNAFSGALLIELMTTTHIDGVPAFMLSSLYTLSYLVEFCGYVFI